MSYLDIVAIVVTIKNIKDFYYIEMGNNRNEPGKYNNIIISSALVNMLYFMKTVKRYKK